MSVVITPKYVNSPKKEGGKYGNIKDADGRTIMVPVGSLGLFRAGTPVRIRTAQKTWGTSDVEVFEGIDQQDAPQQSQPPVFNPRLEPPVVNPPQQASYAPPVQQHPPVSQPYIAPPQSNPHFTDKDALIFITGVVGRSMGSGKFVCSDIEALTHEALNAWNILKTMVR